MYTFLRSLAVASASVGFAAILPGSLRAAVPVPPGALPATLDGYPIVTEPAGPFRALGPD